MTSSQHLLAEKRGSTTHFVCTTFPLVAVLVYFLYEAWRRPSKAIYNLPNGYSAEDFAAAADESGRLISLMDMMLVFLCLLFLWTIFAMYVIIFVAKRRHLVGRYLSEGEATIGDVLYDKTSRSCRRFQDYGYCIYKHPSQAKVIRKRVRVYQAYTRERVTILRLPNRPLSGQPKADLEVDLSAASKERDTYAKQMTLFSVAWVIFSLAGAAYVLYQMSKISDPSDDFSKGKRIFITLVGLNFPLAYGGNWARFLFYRNWMVNRGAVVDDNADTRKIQGCLERATSEDGSDVIPYSILNEEELSYQGTVPSHSGSLVQPRQGVAPSPNRKNKVEALKPNRSSDVPWASV